MTRLIGKTPVPLLAGICAILAFFLAACGSVQQIDPPGQNSGSAQNAPGVFNLDLLHMGKAAPGAAIDVLDGFTTVTTRLTVTGVKTTTNAADTTAGAQSLPTGTQFLLVDVTLMNMSASATGCPNPQAQATPNQCTEFVNPLTNFRIFDDQQRQWSTTTGAKSTCVPAKEGDCDWLRLLQAGDRGVPKGGLKPGMTFKGQLAFLVPISARSFDLYYAPYRFGPVTAPLPTVGTTPGPIKGTATPTTATTGLPPYTVVDIKLNI